MFTVVPGDSAMGGLSLDGFTVGTHKHWCHETQRTKAWYKQKHGIRRKSHQHEITKTWTSRPNNATLGALQTYSLSNRSLLTLSQNVWLHISIIILASPNKSSRGLQDLGHHVVNETVLIPDLQLVKLWLVVSKGKQREIQWLCRC